MWPPPPRRLISPLPVARRSGRVQRWRLGLRPDQPVESIDVRVGRGLDHVERQRAPNDHMRSLAQSHDGFTERVAALGRGRQAEILELRLDSGDPLNSAEHRVQRTVATRRFRLHAPIVANRYFGGAGYAALHIDLDIPQRKASGCCPSERFLDGELQVLGVKGPLALGETEHERVNGSKL